MLVRTALASLLLTSLAAAQVPPGWGAYTKMSRNGGRAGGLLMFHPIRGDFTIVTGLPFQFVGGSAGGARSVLIDPSDGSVYASDCCYNQASLHHVTITGSVVTAARQTTLGPADSGGSINDMTWLPDGRILTIINGITTRTPQSGLLIYNPTNNRFARGPVDPALGTPQAISMDLTGTIAYVAYGIGEIWAVPMDKSQPTLITTVNGGIVDIDTNAAGEIIVATPSRGVWIVDANGSQTRLAGNLDAPTAMTVDPVSGEVFITNVPSTATRMHRVEPDGTTTRIGNMPTADRPTGIDMRPSLLTYGTQHPDNPFAWQTDGNPGGPPRYGNTNFSLTLNSAGATPPGLMLLGLAPLPAPAALLPFADNLLVDLNRLLLNIGLPPGPNPSVSLPLPASSSARGVDLWAQALHADSIALFPFHGGRGLQLHIH